MEEHNILIPLLLTLGAGLATGIGSAIAFFAKRTNKRLLSFSLGLSGGVMIYVSFVELFQQANTTLSAEWGAHTGVIVTVASFFAGILLIGVIDRLVPSIENPHEAHRVEEMDHQPHNPRLMRMGVMTALAIGIGCVPGYARLLRALVLGIRDQEYVEAARVTGASNARIMFRQIVPNILSPVIVDSTLRIGGCILMISSLSFIGLGVQPPTAEWGSMVAEGREVIRSFWPMSTFPGLAIMLTLFGFNLFGDGLRDALDPKLKN